MRKKIKCCEGSQGFCKPKNDKAAGEVQLRKHYVRSIWYKIYASEHTHLECRIITSSRGAQSPRRFCRSVVLPGWYLLPYRLPLSISGATYALLFLARESNKSIERHGKLQNCPCQYQQTGKVCVSLLGIQFFTFQVQYCYPLLASMPQQGSHWQFSRTNQQIYSQSVVYFS